MCFNLPIFTHFFLPMVSEPCWYVLDMLYPLFKKNNLLSKYSVRNRTIRQPPVDMKMAYAVSEQKFC